jgi:hypothetical protein
MKRWLIMLAAVIISPVAGGSSDVPLTVTLAAEATAAERTAADELIRYLETATSRKVRLRAEGGDIHVGPTALAKAVGPDPAGLAPEEWVIMAREGRLFLFGGRPRGTLYAVFRYLEDHVGVRWWTPRDEFVPRFEWKVPLDFDRRGTPTFIYRDVFGIEGPRRFHALNRLNGHFSKLPEEYGEAESYGPPRHVHNFFDYIPPDDYFETNPEFFSERAGLRYVAKGQLCLTEPGLLDAVREKLADYIESSPARLFSFSQNDWGGACECDSCRELASQTGGASGPLVQFVNQLAESIAEEHPDVLLDTLAYNHTMVPPRGMSLRENVVVRFSGFHTRDRSKPVTDPANRAIREALEGWKEVAAHLRVWDYAVSYGVPGDLPLANLPVLARDLRYYLSVGVEGIFLQLDFPVAADMRDLKLWVLSKLLENPARDHNLLVEEFTDGFYGPAGALVRRYLGLLERRTARQPGFIGHQAEAGDYEYLDRKFLLRAQRIFDRAGERVRGDRLLNRRLDHARLSLDRATLWRWPGGLDRDAVVSRYRDTWSTEIGIRYRAEARQAAMAEVDREIEFLQKSYNRAIAGEELR